MFEEQKSSWGWGGADSKLVEFEVGGVSGGQRTLVSRTGVYVWRSLWGRGEGMEWKEKENLLTWLEASG